MKMSIFCKNTHIVERYFFSLWHANEEMVLCKPQITVPRNWFKLLLHSTACSWACMCEWQGENLDDLKDVSRVVTNMRTWESTTKPALHHVYLLTTIPNQTHTHTRTHIHTCICTHTRNVQYIHAHIHTYTHTHTLSPTYIYNLFL